MPESDFALPTAWGRLSGTLLLPDGAGPWPVAVLIAGSGPTDRDGNTPLLPARVDNLRLLGQALARRGVASLRYDKRGVGGSGYPGLSEEALRFEDLVDDAGLLGSRLTQDERFSQVVLVGHSEGALIAALAAGPAQARAVVSIAGAGSRASALMRKQIQDRLPPALATEALATLEVLEHQQRVADVSDDLVLLFRPSVQPYLMSWFRHDPPSVLARLQVPVLLVHGSADAQVGVEHALRLHMGQPEAPLHIVEGMDHLLSIQGDVAKGTEDIAVEVAGWLQRMDVGVVA